MPGFSHVSPNSEIRNWTSWGRTRQPRNLTGTQNAQGVQGVAYETQNQRYLLIWLDSAGPGAIPIGGVQVWSYAIQEWATLNTTTLAQGALHILDIGGSDRIRVSDANGNAFKVACSTFAPR